MTLRVGGLFAGYGGLELGLSSVLPDTHPAWFSEFDEAPSKVLAHHWPGVPNLGDVTAIDWASVEPVDVIAGGSPCQDLSAAGKRAGMKPGTRSGLWAAMCRAIDVIRPSLVVWENVGGAFSAAASSEVELCPGCMGDGRPEPPLRALGRVLGDLSDLGYDAWWYGLRASDVGAAHGRFRVFVFATPADADAREWAERGWPVAVQEAQPDARRAGADAPDRGGRGGAPGVGDTLLPTPTAWEQRSDPEKDTRNLLPLVAQRLLPTPLTADSTPGPTEGREGQLRGVAKLLPTPVVSDAQGMAPDPLSRGYGAQLRDVPVLLPTPQAADSRHAVSNAENRLAQGRQVQLTHAVGLVGKQHLRDEPTAEGTLFESQPEALLPTPTTSDANGPGGHGRGGQDLRTAVGQSLAGPLLPTPQTADAWTWKMENSADRLASGHQMQLTHVVGLMADPPEGLLPTPRATRGGSSTETRDALLPTPTTLDHIEKRNAYGYGNETLQGAAERLLPTPRAGLSEPRNQNIWLRDPSQPQNLENALAPLLLPTPSLSGSGMGGGGHDRDKMRDVGMLPPREGPLLPTPNLSGEGMGGGDADFEKMSELGLMVRRGDEPRAHDDEAVQDWREYEAAIRRWEWVIDREAPSPTERGKNDQPRLAPQFVEWMMGLPEGHVTDPAIGISRNSALKILGNGVVPQQCAAAFRAFLDDLGVLGYLHGLGEPAEPARALPEPEPGPAWAEPADPRVALVAEILEGYVGREDWLDEAARRVIMLVDP